MYMEVKGAFQGFRGIPMFKGITEGQRCFRGSCGGFKGLTWVSGVFYGALGDFQLKGLLRRNQGEPFEMPLKPLGSLLKWS